MNSDHYKALLLEKQRELVARRAQIGNEEREPADGAAGDIGDDSVKDEQQAKLFTEDEADADVLDEVRLALGRIADGSYGRCFVDQQPIDAQRLEAIPWARYCAKHQAALEGQRLRTPTL